MWLAAAFMPLSEIVQEFKLIRSPRTLIDFCRHVHQVIQKWIPSLLILKVTESYAVYSVTALT